MNNNYTYNSRPENTPPPHDNYGTNYQQNYYAGNGYTDTPQFTPRPKRVYTASEKILAFACLFFGYFFMKTFLFPQGYLGKTVFFVSLLTFSVIYMATNKIKTGVAPAVSAVLCGLFSFGFMNTDSVRIQIVTTIFCQLTYAYFVFKTFDRSVERSPGNLFDFDIIKAVFVSPFASFGKVYPAAFTKTKNKKVKISKNALFVIIGLILSVVPTSVIIALLSFDESFKDVLGDIFGNFKPLELGYHGLAILFGIPVAMYLFGLWLSASDGKCAKMNNVSCSKFRDQCRFIPTALTLSTAAPILAVYIIFFVSQFRYFTSAFAGELPDGFIYSEYARKGFFQMCIITGINVLIVALIYIFSHKKGKNIASRIFVSVFSLSSIILVVIAASKMLLYVKSYGLTVNRTYALWFIVTVALVFLAIILKMISPKFAFTPTALAAIIIMLALVVFPNVPRVISNYNTEKILEGEKWELDEKYFRQIGIAAVADALEIIENSDKVNKDTVDAAEEFIEDMERKLDRNEKGFMSFNLSEYAAKKALNEAD